MDTSTLPVIDWSPFKKEDVCKLGLVENWHELLRILAPLASRDFGVTDAVSQAVIDEARSTLDLSFGPVDFEVLRDFNRNVVDVAASAPARHNPAPVLEVLLAVGADPDIENDNEFRASHYCAFRGHLEAASVLFLCRPDMKARNENEDTPLKASQRTDYIDDRRDRESKALRRYVEKFIKDGGFEKGFPSLVELAAQRKWIPMKNLLRRQVVKDEEFTKLVEGKSAADWAEFFGERILAKEIRYYQQPVPVRTNAVASHLLNAVRENSSLDAKLKAVQKEKEEREADLSETVNDLKSQLRGTEEEGGAGTPAKKTRIRRSLRAVKKEKKENA